LQRLGVGWASWHGPGGRRCMGWLLAGVVGRVTGTLGGGLAWQCETCWPLHGWPFSRSLASRIARCPRMRPPAMIRGAWQQAVPPAEGSVGPMPSNCLHCCWDAAIGNASRLCPLPCAYRLIAGPVCLQPITVQSTPKSTTAAMPQRPLRAANSWPAYVPYGRALLQSTCCRAHCTLLAWYLGIEV
jgi:hypothetical protein